MNGKRFLKVIVIDNKESACLFPLFTILTILWSYPRAEMQLYKKRRNIRQTRKEAHICR